MLARQQLLDFVEANDGVLDAEEERASPVNGARHGRVVLAQWRVGEVADKDVINDIQL